MGLRINTNVAAMNAHRNLSIADSKMGKSLERLSSGYRVNSASDDAAGLAIANRLRTNVRSLTVASRNISEATSIIQVAEGAGNQIQSILERLKELATQAASDNVSTTDRTKLNSEATKLKDEIDRIANVTAYQGTSLIDGHYGDYVGGGTADTAEGFDSSSVSISGADTGTYTITEVTEGSGGNTTVTLNASGLTQAIETSGDGAQTLNFDKIGVKIALNAAYVGSGINTGNITTDKFTIAAGSGGTFQIGASKSADDKITAVDFGDLNTAGDLAVSGIDLSGATTTNAYNALDTIDTAIDTLSTKLADMGAYQNRLSYASANVAVSIQNFSASESVIRDVDMASEMTSFTKNQILLQAGTAMLAQANMAPQQVLSLFG